MPENEFEQHVQDKMAELRLRPSDAVWRAVEEEIRKKKRRRFVFLILLLAGLGLAGYSGYTLLDNPKPVLTEQQMPVLNDKKINANSDQSSSHENITPSIENKSEIKAVKVSPAPENSKVNGRTTSSATERKTSDKKENAVAARIKSAAVTKVSGENEKVAGNPSSEVKSQNVISQPGNTDYPEQNEVVKNEIPEQLITAEAGGVGEKEVEVNATASKNSDIESDKRIVDASGEEAIGVDTASIAGALPEEQNDITENKEDVLKRKSLSKIKWGLELSAGAVSSRNHAFSFDKAERFAGINFGYPNTSTSGGSFNPAAPAPPSSVKTGPGFKIGVFGEMKLSKRSSISAGIRYAYLGEKIKVGAYRDTLYTSNSYSQTNVTRGIYQGTKQKWYTNRYHFIELPVTYQLQLNKGNKLPVTWNAGFSVGYLAGANALVYDTLAGGVYFKQNNLLNKMHFNLNTGFAFRFGNKGKLQWSVGPEISLDMTKLMKEDPYTSKRYLLYGGISAKLFLPPLKK